MDWQFLSAFLGTKQKTNANVLYQVMPNTARNKGGLSVTLPDMGEFSFPYEAVDFQDFDIIQELNGMTKTPYNRLYMMYDLKSVDEETNNHSIPLSLKIRNTPVNGRNVLLVSPESPVGNLLLVPGIHGLAVERRKDLLFSKGILTPHPDYEGQYTPGYAGHVPGERIHDIKTLADFINVLVPIYHSMDQGLDLEGFAARFREDLMAAEKRDHAALATPGGIDLNARNLNMESSGQKVKIIFDPAMIAQFRRGDFSGVKIQILDVVPINLMPLLGFKEDEESGQLFKV
jgi:hypothetical protein